jgi:hypothetical protein
MRGAAKALALALLLLLKPACGGGGGGSSVPATPGPLNLPAVVPPIAVDTSGATTTINALGQTDAAVQALLQTALNAGGKIVITHGGTARTIVLTAGANNLPALTMPSSSGNPKSVILDGSGVITLSGNTLYKILQLNDRAQLWVQNMKFEKARTDKTGAAIENINDGVTGSTLRQVTLINCSFDDCKTTSTGPDIGGGAVRFWNGQHTRISGCTFTNCSGSNGGAVNSLGTQLTIINSTFTNNSAFGTGGGSDQGPTGQGGIGGAVYVDNVSNSGSLMWQLSITGCTFDSNHANDHAGAVFGFTDPAKSSTSIVDRCTFKSNTVPTGLGKGGALYSLNGSLTLSNSTLNLNSAVGDGGALACSNNSSLIANCTFQGNTVTGGTSKGGGIHAATGSVSLINVTMAQNSANDFAGGLFSLAASTTVQNSVFTGNTAVGNPAAGTQVNNSFGGGANLQAPVGNKPASSSGTTFTANAMLGALANNGGTTLTMKPLAGSPAINLAGVSGAPLLDQGGNPRNGAPDAGACEGP